MVNYIEPITAPLHLQRTIAEDKGNSSAHFNLRVNQMDKT